jgi:hypothetical protein
MKSLKNNMYEFRKGLSLEQSDIATIITEHIKLADSYSDKEIYGSLNNHLGKFKFYENVNTFLNEVDGELSSKPLIYNLKDLYSKLKRKDQQWLYESACNAILECIQQRSDEDKHRILEDLKMHEWIPEIHQFLFEIASTPQAKSNFMAKGGKIEDVYSLVLQVKEGYLTYVAGSWFLLNKENGIKQTLKESHITDEVQLKKLSLLEDAIKFATFNEDKIVFQLAEGLNISFNTSNKKITMNESETDKGTTLESLFNSPVVPLLAKGFYPILVETFNHLDKFMVLNTVKKVTNILNTTYECYVFNFEGKISQYRVDKRLGASYYTYENAMPLIENVIHELGADLTFFYENQLSEETKAKISLENKEKAVTEKLNDVEQGILAIKESGESLKDNKALESLYNTLLGRKHKLSEELKAIKKDKVKLYN